MALTEDSVIQNEEGNKIQVCSFAGEVKQVIPMAESEGEVTLMDVKGRYMAVVTQNNMIKIFDISRRQYKQIGVTRKFEIKNGEPLGEIKDIQLNCEGKKLCILADQSPFPNVRIPDTKFYIYDVDMDNFMEMEISANRVPIECFWDQSDPRLLSIETDYLKDLNGASKPEEESKILDHDAAQAHGEIDFKKKEEEFTGKTLETFFVTTDYKVKRQDVVKFEEGDETLLGLHVPFFYFMGRQIDENEDENGGVVEETKKDSNNQSNMIILRRPMKDFLGLENVDEATKKAIMNFSFYLTVGNMDEAYNSVRNIKNNTVW
jgi:intraflagellar transport protein 140